MYPATPHGLMKLQASSDTTATEPPTLNPKRNADTKTRVSSSFTPGRSASRRLEPTINAEKAATIAGLRAVSTVDGLSSHYKKPHCTWAVRHQDAGLDSDWGVIQGACQITS